MARARRRRPAAAAAAPRAPEKITSDPPLFPLVCCMLAVLASPLSPCSSAPPTRPCAGPNPIATLQGHAASERQYRRRKVTECELRLAVLVFGCMPRQRAATNDTLCCRRKAGVPRPLTGAGRSAPGGPARRAAGCCPAPGWPARAAGRTRPPRTPAGWVWVEQGRRVSAGGRHERAIRGPGQAHTPRRCCRRPTGLHLPPPPAHPPPARPTLHRASKSRPVCCS